MKACIILFGESFRLGGELTRNRGSDESYTEQINAATSHVSFIKDLISKNVNIDLYISSYETKFTNDLIRLYTDFLIGYDIYPNLIGQHNLIHNSIKKISLDKYDFLLIMRIDIFLKRKFTEIFDTRWNTIMWPSITFKPYHKRGIHPRVNDIMLYIPKKYYKYLKYFHWDINCGHDQWYYFIKNTDLNYCDLDTMINTFHDSDSAKDFNPLYYIVNRPQTNIHHTKGEIFDKLAF
jgi:hypothetical protein